MKQTLHIIALRAVKHNEKTSILSALSLELGPVSLIQPAGNGREATRRRALLMPLGLAECVADIRPNRDIHPIGQVRPLAPLANMRLDPVKSTIALFLADVLSMILRDNQPDPKIWKFIHSAILTLDTIPGSATANFHIAFLVQIAALIGIYPDISSYSSGHLFDMLNGIFRSSAPNHRNFLDSDTSRNLHTILRMNFSNMHRFRFDRKNRAQTLELILQYYTLHHAPLTRLHSLPVLQALFS